MRGREIKLIGLATIISALFSFQSLASMDLETGASVSGIAVALNNYYARSREPEKALSQSVQQVANGTIKIDTEVKNTATQKLVEEEEQSTEPAVPESAYQNIAISKVSGSVNIRSEANTTSGVTGKIYNNSAATILETVDGEDGQWYKIQSGNVTGYIKAEYFVTGAEAEQKATQVGTTYGTVHGTSTLRLRESAATDAPTLTLLAEGATYVVLGQEGDFLKVQVDEDLTGYVFKDYVTTNVEFNKAVSAEEEAAKKAEEEKRKKEAEEALAELEKAKKNASKETTKAEETTKETKKETVKETTTIEVTVAKSTTAKSEETTIAAAPSSAADTVAEAPTTAKSEETTIAKKEETTKATTAQTSETVSKGPGASAVVSATRTAMVAYAKQFLGNPYVYGGTSLTDGADCSGFTMRIYEHFGYSIGRSSRDQAAGGRSINLSDAKPGDLLFYASGDYINHVAMYIGDGKIIHASSTTTGIIISQANYRTPCKVVSFLD